MSRKKEIVKQASIYTIASYVAQVFDVFNGILVRRFLGPANMGIWSLLQVVLNYAKHSAVGVTTATARDVPYYREKGDFEKADRIKNVVFSFTVLTACVTAAGIVIYALAKRGSYGQSFFYGLLAVAPLIILQRLYHLRVVLLRALKDFVFVSKLNVVSSVLSVLFTITLTWKFKLYGLFLGLILNYLGLILWIRIRSGQQFAFELNFKELSPIFSLGLAMLLYDVLTTILLSVDRIMIAKFMGLEALGIYSIALMAGNFLYGLPNMLSVVLFPHLQEMYAKRDDHRDLAKFITQPTLVLAYLFPCVIALVWFAAAWIFPILLPDYSSGIPALRYFILGSYFVGLTHPFSSFFVTVRKHWHLCPVQAMLVFFSFLLTWFMIQKEMGIQGVALAMAITSVLRLAILSGFSFAILQSHFETVKIYGKILFSFLYFTGSLFLIGNWFQPASETFWKVVFEFLVFLVLMSPFFYLAEKETQVLSTVKSTLFRVSGGH